MNEQDYRHLLEIRWRRALSLQEDKQLQAFLGDHPELRAVWEDEATLSEALEALPPVPLSSNFTARVLEAIDAQGETRKGRKAEWRRLGWWQVLFPRVGWVAFAILLLCLVIVQHERAERRQVAASLSALSAVAAAASPELLQDFEAIDRLRQVSQVVVDEELLNALQ